MTYSTGYGDPVGASPGAAQAPYSETEADDPPWAEEARFMGADSGAQAYATESGGGALRGLFHGTAALASIGLLAWIGVWGYGQVMRDVSGVPVVRALEGPMRVLPERPGGQISDHTGLAVNAVKAGSPEQDQPSTVLLAPSAVPLADEDLPAADLNTAQAVPLAPLPSDPGFPIVEAALETGAAEAPAATAESQADALARALQDGLAPLAEEAEALEDQTTTNAVPGAADGVVPVTEPGVSRSPRPQIRPDRLSQIEAGTATAAFISTSGAESASTGGDDLAPVAAGTRLVQLGAFDSVDEARVAWGEIDGQFGPLMADKARVVQQAEAGGRTFWRLRASGFPDLAEARRFCAALVAERTDCIPVVAR